MNDTYSEPDIIIIVTVPKVGSLNSLCKTQLRWYQQIKSHDLYQQSTRLHIVITYRMKLNLCLTTKTTCITLDYVA